MSLVRHQVITHANTNYNLAIVEKITDILAKLFFSRCYNWKWRIPHGSHYLAPMCKSTDASSAEQCMSVCANLNIDYDNGNSWKTLVVKVCVLLSYDKNIIRIWTWIPSSLGINQALDDFIYICFIITVFTVNQAVDIQVCPKRLATRLISW